MGVMVKIILWVYSILAIFATVACKNSGMYVYFSNEALNELCDASMNYGVIGQVTNSPIDDLHGDSLGGIIRWSFTDIAVTALAKPDINVWLEDSKMLSGEINGFTCRITGNYRIKLWGASTSGTFDGTLCANGGARLTLGDDDIVKMLKCDANADCGMAIFLDDKHFSMPTIIQDSINSYAKDILSSKMKEAVCGSFKQYDLNKKHLMFPLNTLFTLNGRVKEMVNINKKGVVIGGSGAVLSRNANITANAFDENRFLVPDIKPLSISTSKMMEMVLTNYTVSTFVYNAVRQGCLNKVLRSRTLPPDQRIFMAVECFDVCIGKLFPSLEQKFPDGFVDVDISVDTDITSRISEQSVAVNSLIVLDFHIGNYSVLKASMKARTSARPYIVPDTVIIMGKLLNISIENLKVISSSVGHVPMSSLTWLSETIKKIYLIPRIQDILGSGINMEYTTLTNDIKDNIIFYRDAEIKLNKNAIDINVNLAIRPEEHRGTPPIPPR